MSLSGIGKQRWIEPFIWSAIALFIVGVLTETAGRYLRAWPPVTEASIELIDRDVIRGSFLRVAVSYRMTRSGCLKIIHREIRLPDGIWWTVASATIAAPAPPPGFYEQTVEVQLDPEWGPGLYYYRVFATFDCAATELVGGRQYHTVQGGPFVFRIVDADE